MNFYKAKLNISTKFYNELHGFIYLSFKQKLNKFQYLNKNKKYTCVWYKIKLKNLLKQISRHCFPVYLTYYLF